LHQDQTSQAERLPYKFVQPGFFSQTWHARWRAFRFPIDLEKQALLRKRWNSLPSELRTPNQLAGRHLTHCGFTTGASYCSFRCTYYYLPANADEVPIPSLTS
jgi:hypothetical protein